jgi:hypothetical protein
MQLEQSVGEEKSRNRNKHLHRDVEADNDREYCLFEEVKDHPRVSILCAHQEVSRVGECAARKHEKLKSLKDLYFSIVPRFSS